MDVLSLFEFSQRRNFDMSKKTSQLRYRKFLLLAFDALCIAVICAIYFGATRLVDNALEYEIKNYLINSAILLVSLIVFRVGFGIYFNVWRYTSTRFNLMLIISDAFGGVFAMLGSKIAQQFHGIWFFVTVSALCALAALAARFCYRMIYKYRNQAEFFDPQENKISVAIVGAGQVGVLLANELLYSKSANYKPIFFIDKDRTKIGSRIAGLKVYPADENT